MVDCIVPADNLDPFPLAQVNFASLGDSSEILLSQNYSTKIQTLSYYLHVLLSPCFCLALKHGSRYSAGDN